MPDKPSNTLVVEGWTILNASDDPLTGMTAPADVTFYLHRESSGTMIAAAETVTLAEIGATGHYYITFTPENTGLYVLQLEEINASTQLRWMRFPGYNILPAGAVYSPVFSNAYCSEADVERYSGLQFSGSSRVTTNMAAGFAEERASVLTSIMESFGYTTSPAAVAAGSRLEDILRAANAIGAAIDAVISWYAQVEPARTDKAAQLLEQWIFYVGGVLGGQKIQGILQGEVNALSSLSTSHIISGDTTVRTAEGAPVDVGLQIKMGDSF